MLSEESFLFLTPAETDPQYFRIWQRVSLALQKGLRTWIPRRYFREDVARYEDRDTAQQLVVYEACRICFGRPRTEFTYDVADPGTLPAALRAIGRAMQNVLDRIERELHAAGRPELARRYAPVWHQDILRAVQKKPKRLIGLLAIESASIDALIEWGTVRNGTAEKRFMKTLTAAARVYGVDVQELRTAVLEETTRVLGGQPDATDSLQDLVHSGILEGHHARAARSPDAGIG